VILGFRAFDADGIATLGVPSLVGFHAIPIKVFFGSPRGWWIRGRRAENADAIGIEPVHWGVDFRGLLSTPGVSGGQQVQFHEPNRCRQYPSARAGTVAFDAEYCGAETGRRVVDKCPCETLIMGNGTRIHPSFS
jgi:hypothetical protein